MSDNSTVRQIRAITFMRDLDKGLQDKVIELFAIAATPFVIEAGTIIFKEGSAASDEGILLLQGEIAIRKSTAPEHIAAAPDLIGEMGQYNPQKTRTATVVAHTRLKVLRFEWPSFHKAADCRLSPSEQQQVNRVLQDHAWRHFTE